MTYRPYFCLLVTALVTACGSANSVVTPPTPASRAAAVSTVSFAAQRVVYVTNECSGIYPQSFKGVYAYDESGSLIETSGSFADGGGEGITFDPLNNRFYVANSTTTYPGFIHTYDREGNAQPQLPFPGIIWPWAIAFDINNRLLYVTSQATEGAHAIFVFDEAGRPVKMRGTFPNVDGPNAVVVDAPRGRIYVANASAAGTRRMVTVYDEQGHQIPTSGAFDWPFSTFGYGPPQAMDVDPAGNRIFVAGLQRMRVYDLQGNLIHTRGNFPDMNWVVSMAFDAVNRQVYVTNNFGDGGAPQTNVTVYDMDGNEIGAARYTFSRSCMPGGITIAQIR